MQISHFSRFRILYNYFVSFVVCGSTFDLTRPHKLKNELEKEQD